MKIILPLFIFIILGLYLNNTYAEFYHKIGRFNLPNPSTEEKYIFNKNKAQKIKYVALGDSLSAGIGAKNYQNTFPYLLADHLSQNNNVELVNLGIPGAKSSDVINRELDETIREKPDLITLMIGINDMHGWIISQTFEKNLEIILSALQKETKAKIIVINIPYLGTGNIKNTPIQSFFDWRTSNLNKTMEKIVKKKNIQYIDLYTLSKLQSQTNPKYYSQDDFHPSDEGYIYWSNIINASINP